MQLLTKAEGEQIHALLDNYFRPKLVELMEDPDPVLKSVCVCLCLHAYVSKCVSM